MVFRRANSMINEILPSEIKEMFSYISQGEIPLTEEMVNKYVEENLFQSNSAINNVYISLLPDLIKITATAKYSRLLPPVNMSTAFQLINWVFRPDDHRFTFQQVQKLELNMDKAIIDYLFRFTVVMIEKVVGPDFISDTAINYAASSVNYIEQIENQITFILDKHPYTNRILQKKVAIHDNSIHPLDFIDIQNISIREGIILIQPRVKWHDLGSSLLRH